MADQSEEKKETNLDPKSFLLPKKEVHTPDSAQRQSAGVLLAQEQTAAKEGLTPAAPAPAPTPTPQAEPKKDASEVKSIQTYKSDVESLVQEKNVSVVSIASAEAKKREGAPLQTPAPAATEDEHWLLKRTALIIGGVLLIAVAAGAFAFVYTRPTTVPVTPLSTGAPFITVDDTKQVSIDPTATPTAIMTVLNNTRAAVNLSLGLVERLYVTQGSGNNAQSISAQKFLAALAPRAPQALLRTLSGDYLLGVHSYDENQAFLIFHTDAYETAYAAMLEWEPTMRADLLPLFERTPPVHASMSAAIATTTATSTAATSSTPTDFFSQQSQTLPVPTVASSGIPTTFADRVVENHDARVIQTKDGDILLLWTFLDRTTLVIATNEFTLREIINRVAKAPTVPLPQ